MPKAATAGTRSRARKTKPISTATRIALSPDKSEQDVWRELLAQDGLEWLAGFDGDELFAAMREALDRLESLTAEAQGRIDAAKTEAELLDRRHRLKTGQILLQTDLHSDPSPERCAALWNEVMDRIDDTYAGTARLIFDARAAEFLKLARSKLEALCMLAVTERAGFADAEKGGLLATDDDRSRYKAHLETCRLEWEARVHRGEFGGGETTPDRHDTAPFDNLAAIGQAIHHFRTYRGWSQDDLVEASKKTTAEGINKRSLQRYENGKLRMRPRTKVKLLKTLGINAEDFDREVTKRRQIAAK